MRTKLVFTLRCGYGVNGIETSCREQDKLLQLMLSQTQTLFLQRCPPEVVALVVALELGRRPAMAS